MFGFLLIEITPELLFNNFFSLNLLIMNCNISISRTVVQPYIFKNLEDLPNLLTLSQFSNFNNPRQEFLIYPEYNQIDIQVSVINETYLKSHPRKVSGILSAYLEDSDGNIISSTEADIFLDACEERDVKRLCMPLDPSQVNGFQEYSIKYFFTNKLARIHVDPVYVDCKVVTFLFINDIKMLPTKWFDVKCGYITVDVSFDTSIKGRSIGMTSDSFVGVNFDAISNFPKINGNYIPELEIMVTDPLGSSEICCARLSSSKNDEGQEIVTARADFAFDNIFSGVYYAELRCMGYPIGGFLFSNRGDFLDGVWEDSVIGFGKILDYTPEEGTKRFRKIASMLNFNCDLCNHGFDEQSDAKQLPEMTFEDLVGLDLLKKRVKSFTQIARFNKLRTNWNLPATTMPLHSMFLGSPGTGKTTVAELLGKELKKAGVLSKGHVVVKERATLCGQNYNSEAENTKKALEEAKGGILFIDEACQLSQPNDPRDPGKFVIEALMTALSDNSNRDWMLILAGYSKPTRKLFDINPGLRSRIPEINIFEFDDFNEDELIAIGERYLSRYHFKLSEEARKALSERIRADFRNRDKEFGNGRYVINLIELEILPKMAARVDAIEVPNSNDLTEITLSDIPTTLMKTNRESRIGFAV